MKSLLSNLIVRLFPSIEKIKHAGRQHTPNTHRHHTPHTETLLTEGDIILLIHTRKHTLTLGDSTTLIHTENILLT